MRLNDYAAEKARTMRRMVLPGLPAAPAARSALRGATTTDFKRHDTVPLEVAGLPSVKIETPPNGGLRVVVTLRSRYAAQIAVGGFMFLEPIAIEALRRYVALSRGPLRSAALRAMGHPYGRDKGGIGRRLPRTAGGRRLGNVRGIRGSVADLAVVNSQTGRFANAWQYEIVAVSGGVQMVFSNTAPWAVFLATGTRKMQAHGPFTYVIATMQTQIRGAWQREINAARQAVAQ